MPVNNIARKVPFTGLLELRQLEELDRLSKLNDEAKSEILRRAVDRYLAEEQSA
jgi:hypothetical protein